MSGSLFFSFLSVQTCIHMHCILCALADVMTVGPITLLLQPSSTANERRISRDVKSEEGSSNYEAGSQEVARMMITCVTEKNIPQPHRYSIGSCQFSSLYFHDSLFIPLIRIVSKLTRGKKPQYKIGVKRDAFPANHNPLKGASEKAGHCGERRCVLAKGAWREQWQGG